MAKARRGSLRTILSLKRLQQRKKDKQRTIIPQKTFASRSKQDEENGNPFDEEMTRERKAKK